VRGVIKGCNIFGGSKIGKHSQLCGRAHCRATRKKHLESRTQMDEPAECTSGGDPVFLYKILHLLIFHLVWIICTLPLESRKQLSTRSWCGTFGISVSSAESISLNPFRTLSLCFGVIYKHQVSSTITVLLKRFLSASAIVIMSWQDVTFLDHTLLYLP
jgi:hypothetical protein